MVLIFSIMKLAILNEHWSLSMLMVKLQEEVSKLISATLGEREREIIRLYYGLDKECLTWEDISKRYVSDL